MIAYKYSKIHSAVVSLFKSVGNILFFTRRRFVWPSSAFKRILPLTQQNCPFEGCDLCIKTCPNLAIRRDQHFIRVNQTACLECDLCRQICPYQVIKF